MPSYLSSSRTVMPNFYYKSRRQTIRSIPALIIIHTPPLDEYSKSRGRLEIHIWVWGVRPAYKQGFYPNTPSVIWRCFHMALGSRSCVQLTRGAGCCCQEAEALGVPTAINDIHQGRVFKRLLAPQIAYCSFTNTCSPPARRKPGGDRCALLVSSDRFAMAGAQNLKSLAASIWVEWIGSPSISH